MRIWTLGEILATEHLGHERYVRDEDCQFVLQEMILKRLEQDKETRLASKGRQALTKAQSKVIDRLRKEKEWLIWKVIGDERYGMFSSGKAEKIGVLKEMQQALKEK